MLLKRGLSATLEEWLMAAEYVLDGGQLPRDAVRARHADVRDHSRNTLAVGIVPA